MSCDIHLRAISQEMLKISIPDMLLKITTLALQPNLLGANELDQPRSTHISVCCRASPDHSELMESPRSLNNPLNEI